jgi:hypothetical protein
MVRRLEPGDDIIMRTATGAVYTFTVSRQFTAEPQQVELFSQRQSPGLTLFALPAGGKPVPVARAVYLAANEELTGLGQVAALGETIEVGGAPLTVTAVTVDETADGLLAIRVSGEVGEGRAPAAAQPLLLSLITPAGQYGPESGGQLYAEGSDGDGRWQAVWRLPPGFVFGQARLHLASLYDQAALVDLGTLARPAEGLAFRVSKASWDERTAEGVVTVVVTNGSAGAARLDGAQFRLSQQGGDIARTIQPHLPLLLEPGATVALELRFRPSLAGLPVLLQAGPTLWEVSNLPEQ